MTTYTIYANTDLVDITHESATYSAARQGTGTATVRSSRTSAEVRHLLSAGVYKVSQAFMSFDTRALPAYPPSMPVELTVQLDVPGDMGSLLFEASEIETYSALASDFIPGGSLPSSPVYGETAGTLFPNNADVGTTFPGGPATIDRVARYCIAFWVKNQRLNSAPSVSGSYGFLFGTAYFDSDSHPFLTITYLPEATVDRALDAVTSAASATISPVTATASPAIDAVSVVAEGVNGVRIAGSPVVDPITATITSTAKVPVSQAADRTITFNPAALAERTLTLED